MSSVHGEDAEEADDHAHEGDVEHPEELHVVIANHPPSDTDDNGNSDDGAPVDHDEHHDELDDPTVNPNILENLSDGSSDGPSPRRPRPRRPGPRRSSPTRQELKEEVHRLIILAEDMVKDDSMDKKLKALRQEVRQLRKTVAQLKGEPTRIVPWSGLLRSYINGNPERATYHDIYRACCKQENMSMTLSVFHPDFNLLPEGRDDDEPEVPVLEAYMSREKPSRPHNSPPDNFPRHPPLLEWRPFPFEELPWELQVKIFRLVFVKRGLVHCLSRLDPFVPPSDFPAENEENHSQLPKRFHFGTSPCQIRRARRPNDFLRPLLVCKRWYFVGVHAFYGANTFAFSSLGEFHRFFNGIGAARVERIANIEIMWHGALMPVQNPQLSLRTIGLAWLLMTRRLRTLVVHIAESIAWRRRRGNETRIKKVQGQRVERHRGLDWDRRPNGGLLDEARARIEQAGESSSEEDLSDRELTVVDLLIRQTDKQPDWRKNRSMQTIQGMDYIRSLRGMKWVRFLERDGDEHRQSIRDWTFLQYINTSVTMPKQPKDAAESELENLKPLSGLNDWIPTEQDILIIKAFYDETPIADPVGGSDASELADGSSSDSHSSGGSDNGDRNPRGPNNGGGADVIESDDSGSDSDPSDGFDGPLAPNENGQNDDGDRMDIDDESNLFVSERSGSPDDPPTPESEDGLFVRSGSGSAPPPDRIVIDLTGEETDDEDDGSPPSEDHSLSSERVKSEPRSDADQALSNQVNNMTLNDDGGDSDDEHRFMREESPPDSEDESDIDTGSDPINYAGSPSVGSPSAGPPSPSSKRSGEDSASSDGGEHSPKRPRID